MRETESLFNPINDTLGARVSAYRSVFDQFVDVKSSLKNVQTKKNTGYIGEKKEVEYAYHLIERSMKDASKSVSKNDLLKAKTQGLLSDKEFIEIERITRKQQIEKVRENSSNRSYNRDRGKR